MVYTPPHLDQIIAVDLWPCLCRSFSILTLGRWILLVYLISAGLITAHQHVFLSRRRRLPP